jgi:hypothetical protein
MRNDALFRVPLRLGVLVRYGEGPHMSAFAVLPIALACGWHALVSGKVRWIALSGISCALVVLTNFYGATALAVSFPILVWTLWVTHDDARMWPRAAAIVASSYGLAAFWLVPSYLRITLRNLEYVSGHGNSWSRWTTVAIVLSYALITWRYARGQRSYAYTVFTAGTLVLFAWIVLGKAYLGVRIIGEPHRLTPEFDLAFILFAAQLLQLLWHRLNTLPNRSWWHPARLAIVVGVVAAFLPSVEYVKHAWDLLPVDRTYQDRVEYRLTEWIGQNLPGARVDAEGSVRIWYTTWRDLAQLGGASDQGTLNDLIIPAQYQIRAGGDPQTSVLWLKALGVDAVIVCDKDSQEIYHDYANPKKFENVLPVIFNDGRGNTIYKIPRRFPGIVRVVRRDAINAIQKPRFNEDLPRLRAYADAIEQGPDSPTVLDRDTPDRMTISSDIKSGESIIVQETYDPAWHAFSGGHELTVRADAMGFMRLDPPPGRQKIQLSFETPLENRIGNAVSTWSLLFCLLAIFFPHCMAPQIP